MIPHRRGAAGGDPPIVYGLVGMIVLVPAIQRTFQLASGATLLAAIVVLAVMILPSIINVAGDRPAGGPREYEEASLALGATHIETIFRISLLRPAPAWPRRWCWGVGRAIGEAMAIIMVSGNAYPICPRACSPWCVS